MYPYLVEHHFPDGIGPSPGHRGGRGASTASCSGTPRRPRRARSWQPSWKYLEFAAVALLLGMSCGQAAELAGGPIDGGITQHVAVCNFFNAGNGTVTLGNPRITNINGFVMPLTVNECRAVLEPGRSCGIAALVVADLFTACKASITPSKADVRGVLEMRDRAGVTLQNIELR